MLMHVDNSSTLSVMHGPIAIDVEMPNDAAIDSVATRKRARSGLPRDSGNQYTKSRKYPRAFHFATTTIMMKHLNPKKTCHTSKHLSRQRFVGHHGHGSCTVKATMKRRESCNDTAKEWESLIRLSQIQLPSVLNFNGESEHDPFDCRDVAVPPTCDLVEGAVKEFQLEWKRLDDRKVVQSAKKELEESERHVQFQGEPRKKKATGWRYVEDRLRLPYNFDYATLGPEPEDDRTGDRVLSLTGLLRNGPHSNTLSYEGELWKLFASVPNTKQLEEQARAGAQLSHTIAHQKEVIGAMKGPQYPDAHMLLRMRMSDRHGLPPLLPSTRNGDGYIPSPDTATIRLECWRRQVKRIPNPDPFRLVLEFLAEQTLLDVHSALVQLAEDDLWDNGVKEETPSGCFFLEDVFYTHGPVDYTKPILDWIDGGREKPNPARRGYLGMSSMEKIPVKPMQDTRLGDIPLRLGYRYYHACHGDVETAVFVVDRRWTRRSSPSYPILHDIWTAGSNLPLCDACKTHAVAYITSTSCHITDQQRRLLCQHCSRLLQIPADSINLFCAWRDESLLSTSVANKAKRSF